MLYRINKVTLSVPFVLASLMLEQAYADSSSIDKIYDPYVEALEKEVEYLWLYNEDTNEQMHKLGYGQSLSDRWFTELGVIAEKQPGEDSEVEAVEWEVKYQLTEQGEFNNDWGWLFEVEREFEENIWEANNTLVVLHEWGRWVGTLNASVIYEWGSEIDNEWETAASAQIKYRYRRAFEPGLEVFVAEETEAIGPIVMGSARLGGRKNLFWECGVIAGLDDETPDVTVKAALEFEF